MTSTDVKNLATFAVITFALVSCSGSQERKSTDLPPLPIEVIDLSPTVTEDLPVRMWGHKQLSDLGFSDTTEFRHIEHNPPPFYFVNSYLTLFNHAGPHIDAPNHIARGARGIDEFPLGTFVGPLRLFDLRNKPKDQPLARVEFEGKNIRPGDIVIAFVGYMAPTTPDELPSFAFLGPEAAEYLANIPVRMFGTDAFGVGPAHPAFLSRDIPVVEQLVGLEQVVGKRSPVFVGFPLKIAGANGSPVRAAALIY